MKFNTITYDANLPTVQQVNVPTNTDYKVGIKVKRNGEFQQLDPDEITIYAGDTTIPTDSEKTNGYVTFTRASGDIASFTQLVVVVDTTSFTEKFKLNVNIYKSQVGDIDAGGPGGDIDVNSVTAKTISVVDSTGELEVAALSRNSEGHGILVLDNIAFTGADLSATFEANQILEGLV